MMIESTKRRRRRPAALITTLLLAVLAFGVTAQQAAAIPVLYAEVGSDLATEYAEQVCRRQKPDCEWGYGGCRQQGKFQVSCWAVTQFETVDETEFWECRRHIRYTAEKRAYRKHKRVVKHRSFLGPWICEPHHLVKQY